MKKNNKNGGFIKIIIVVIAALVLLKYIYDIDVIGFLTQGKFKELLDKFYGLGTEGWLKYRDTVIEGWGYIIEFIKKIVAKV